MVLLAFACHPDAGSEPGAGYEGVLAALPAAERLTVITRVDADRRLEEVTAGLVPRPEIVRLATPFDRSPGVYRRYLYWTWLAARQLRAQRASTAVGTIVHHVTYASDWLPTVFSFMEPGSSRFVWGPVGGATYLRLRHLRLLPLRPAAADLARSVLTRLVRRLTRGNHRRRVHTAIALNPDAATGLAGYARVLVRPNVVLDYEELPVRPGALRTRTPRRIVWAGRGVWWKGLHLAIAAAEHLPADWELVVLGKSTDSPHFRSLVRPGGAQVTFLGRLPRAESLEAVASAAVFVLPSLHDSAPWAAAEAAALGVPVVCLDQGGPAIMAGSSARAVPIDPSASLVQRLADAIAAAAEEPVQPASEPFWTRNAYAGFLADAYGLTQ